MKKAICILIAISLMMSLCSISVGATDLIIRPYADYYSVQNPPDFSWRYTLGATYALKIARNRQMTEDVIEITGLKKNLYNFSEPFEPGEYWWSYKTNSGAYTTPRRFYIAENAWEYTIPYDYENIELNLPEEHPRLLFTKENLEELKKGMKSEDSYYYLRNYVEKDINGGILTVPGEIAQSELASKYSGETYNILMGATLYLMSGNERYKKYTIDMLDAISATDANGKILWAPENAIKKDSSGVIFNTTTDVYICLAAYNLALCYDWMYNELDDTLKTRIVNLIESILKYPTDEWTQDVAAQSKNIYMFYLGSHNYRLNQLMIAALAIYEEVGENSNAHRIVNRHLPIMINFTSPFTYQDGGNAQGNFYGVSAELGIVHEILANLGIVDIRKKASSHNSVYKFLYNWNTKEHSVFGDGYHDLPSTYHYGNNVQQIIAKTDNKIMAGVNKWLLNDSTNGYDFFNYNHIGSILHNERIRDVKPVEPYMLPTARLFKDIGWVSLNSDLADDKRISLKFKSSPYGSYNHSHPDQNSFVINAFGEYVLTDPGYYDAYHSKFDLAWSKKTYAHNAITFNNGVGQPYNNYHATGKVTGFLNNNDFDLITGDATAAYNTERNMLSKSVRNILYLKPDVFVVIDDLKSYSGDKKFEFWLNTRGSIDDVEDGSATVKTNNVTMFSDCVYPSDITVDTYIDNYNGPDGTILDTSALTVSSVKKDAESHADSRIGYITGAVPETKIVNVLSFVEGTTKPVAVRTSEEDGYIKLTVTDRDTREQTLVYVNNGATGVISDSSVSFKGDAAVISPDGDVMLINGTELTHEGVKKISSDVNVSASVCGERVSISNMDKDASVTFHTGIVSEVHKTEGEREVKLEKGVKKYGILYETNGEYTTFNAYPGTYTLNLNDSLHEGYVKLDVSSSEGGNISGSPRRMIGMNAEFSVEPDEGYLLSSLTFNGEPLEVNSENKFTTPVITEEAVIRAEFLPVGSATPQVVTSENIYSVAKPDGMEVTIFGTCLNGGAKMSEYGILYSYADGDFTISDADGKNVRKLPCDSKLISKRNKFGVQIKDKTKTSGMAYARAYMKIGNDVYYGDVVGFNRTFARELALISELKVANGKLSPEFKPSITEYVVSTESGVINEEDISFRLPPDATSEIIISDFGKCAEIKVAAYNTDEKTYTLHVEEEKEASGTLYASENTKVSHRASERDKDVFNEDLAAENMTVYQYRLDKTNNYDVILRFNLDEINPFADKFKLRMRLSSENDGLAGHKVAVHDVSCDPTVSLNGLSYTQTFGSHNFIKGEKIAVLSYDERAGLEMKTDITEYIQKKYAAGERTITLLLIADESSWPEDFAGEELKIFYFRPLAYPSKSYKPAIIWEGE